MSGGRIRKGGKGVSQRRLERLLAEAPWVARVNRYITCDRCAAMRWLTSNASGSLRSELSFREFHLRCPPKVG